MFCESREETQISIYERNILMDKTEFHSQSNPSQQLHFLRCTSDWHVFKQRPISVVHPVYACDEKKAFGYFIVIPADRRIYWYICM